MGLLPVNSPDLGRDGLHRRVVKSHINRDGKTVWTHFIYDAANQVVEERETDAREKGPLIASRQYVWDDDGRLASMIVGKPQKVYSNSKVEYSVRSDRLVPLYDETGSTVAVLSQGPKHDGNFVLKYRVEYDPAGNPRKLTPTFDYDSEQWDNEDPFPYLFAGQRYDAETGLYHTEGGQYHPRLGAVANPAFSGYELPSERVQSITPQEISGPPENFLSFPYNPTIPDARSPIQTIAHTVFAVGGMIPGYGALFDVADAILYAAEGDYTSMSFSLVAAVPGVGDVAAGAKWVKKAQQAVKVSKRAGKGAQVGAKVNSAAKLAGTAIKYRRQGSILLNYGLSGYHVVHGIATGNPWEIGAGILGTGLNSAFAARMLKNARGPRGLLARRNGARALHSAKNRSDEVVDFLSSLTGPQKANARRRIIELLESGDDYSRALAATLRAKKARLKFSNLPKGKPGRYVEGSYVMEVASEYVAKGKFDDLASVTVHESQHLVDDLAEKLARFSRRRREFRAHARQLAYESAIGRGPLLNDYKRGGFKEVGSWIELIYEL